MLLYSSSAGPAIGAGRRGVAVDGDGDLGRGLPVGMVAVPAGGLRRPGGAIADEARGGGALLAAVGGGLVSGQSAVFAAPVVVAPAVVRRDGRVQAGGHLADHVRLGVLEEHLGAGVVEELVARFGVGERRLRGLSAAMSARCVLAMTLLPEANLREVMATVAGQLPGVPWARPWQVPGGEVLSRHRTQLGDKLFEELSAIVAARVAAEPEHVTAPAAGPDEPDAGWLGGLLLCSGDGVVTRCADTDANRAAFGSTGTSDDSAPYPQVRAVLVSVCATRAVLGAALDSCAVGEQALTARIAATCPGVFGPGRLYLFDRNFLGGELVADLLATGAHLLMRMKAGIDLPNLGWCPDGSYRSRLRAPGRGTIEVRVVDYDVAPPDGVDTCGELFCLVTDLLDHQAYPAAALAAAYPWRWTGSETTIKENKSTITDAGPSRGPILRSTSPVMVRQEFWAWLTATNLVRAAARAAARTPVPSTPTRPARPLPARAVSFAATCREATRSMIQSTRTRLADLAESLRSQRIQLDRHRHRPRVTKCRQRFPPAKPATPTITGAGQILIRGPRPLPSTG